MRKIKGFWGLFLSTLLCASPAFAWTTLQGNGQMLVRQETNGFTIELACDGSMNNQMIFSVARDGGRNMPRVNSIGWWVFYADGRQEWRVVDVQHFGQYVSGTWFVSDLVLNEFRYATGFEFRIDGNTSFRTDAKGTGAARLAILEQCGF